MLKVGLTGGIGSGKSTVAELFADLGAPIIDADQIAHRITDPGTPALNAIIDHFGTALLSADGWLQRAKLREIIFNYPAEREWLEQLLHPLITKEIEHAINKLNAPYCILVIPLLAEKPSAVAVDRVLVVDCDPTIQVQRVAKRDHLSQEDVQKILSAQASKAERQLIADDIVVNNGDLAELQRQVANLHQHYLKLGV